MPLRPLGGHEMRRVPRRDQFALKREHLADQQVGGSQRLVLPALS
jgi:hypothetical protein